MRIRVLSDLHVTHEHNAWRNVPDVDCDVTVILGDVANPMTSGMEWVARTFSRPLIYVCGNHCFYRGLQGSGEEHTFYQQQKERGREMADRFGITFLDNEVAIVEDVRFLGATLWSDFSILPPGITVRDAMSQSQKGWSPAGGRFWDNSYHNDFREIRFGGGSSRHRFTPSQMLALHRESRAFLERELSTPFAGETVCLTHMAPSRQSLEPGIHAHDWLYACSLEQLMEGENAPALWCHGHIHRNRDYVLGNTRVICNPRGYAAGPRARENPDFIPDLVVEVEPTLKPSFGV